MDVTRRLQQLHREGQGAFAPGPNLPRIRISLHTTTSRIIATSIAIMLIAMILWATTLV
ncbi:hypothetical protein [Nocardia iowensis]|uniref:Uncharacterized protein n=1 Tax=Nocardia iowensis TaxID=204891 RepID=A0ABX8RYJ3_NOCIO|nr:hypothetical protein [Nocardia iowensis]QXN94728.1 hypothetical protein KV110_17760 [Nocardia iowensis]